MSNNVIQFPERKGQPTPAVKSNPSSVPSGKLQPKQKVIVGAVLSILFATVVTNRTVYNANGVSGHSDLSSVSGSRAIASIATLTPQRDAKWERSIADALASADVRGPAAFNVGREVTPEEQLELGSLQRTYSLVFNAQGHQLRSILLQGDDATPTYLSPEDFFKSYGRLLSPNFRKATAAKAPVHADGRVFETYNVLDQDNKPVLEALFERDRHGRLLSMKIKELAQL